jgi:hypothetical protein
LETRFAASSKKESYLLDATNLKTGDEPIHRARARNQAIDQLSALAAACDLAEIRIGV